VGPSRLHTPRRPGDVRRPLKLAGLLAAALLAVLAFGAAPALAEPAPVLTIGAPTQIGGTTVHVSGTINPEGGSAASFASDIFWFFEYSTEPGNPQSWISAGTPNGTIEGADAESTIPIPVGGEIRELSPNTKYSIRLRAADEEFRRETILEGASFTTLKLAPSIERTFASAVTTSTATLNANIRPGGVPTTYHFQYISGAAFKADGEDFGPGTIETLESASIGSGNAERLVSAPVTGLTPGTTYDFRVVAHNEVETVTGPVVAFQTFRLPVPESDSCPNSGLRAGSSAGLPDCRAYEQVTPADKNHVNALGNPGFVQSSPSGSAVSFFSLAPFPTVPGFSMVPGAGEYPTYFATRHLATERWFTQGLNPAQEPGSGGAQIPGWTEDLSKAIVVDNEPPLAAGAVPGESNSYLYTAATGAYEWLSSGEPDFFVDATPDDSHILFESAGLEVVAGIRDENENRYLYMWNATKPAGKRIQFVGWVGGSAPEAGTLAGAGRATEGYYAENTISEDGVRVFFTDREDERLYMRDTVAGATTPVSEGPAVWRASTPDGSFVFYTEAGALFRFDVATEQREELTAHSSEVEGTSGISEDGTYAYFAAHAALATGAVAGSDNLYEWHSGEITFVATVGSTLIPKEENEADWRPNNDFPQGKYKSARVTPGGTKLLFLSTEAITGYQTNAQPEMYLFDAAKPRSSGNPICISCNPTGSAATTGVRTNGSRENVGSPADTYTFLPRTLSSNGEFVFFETSEGLVPRDTNGTFDVYEWESPEAPGCHSSSAAFSAANAGCVFLISTGQSPQESSFGDASATGEDVFVFTYSQLVGQDRDGNSDLYDARVNGGLAAQNPSALPALCNGEACKGSMPPAPALLTPGSVTFSGPGNVSPPVTKPVVKPKKTTVKCGKGKKRRHGRCVRPKRKKRAKARKAMHTDRRAR
jgi:hypothetical protein